MRLRSRLAAVLGEALVLVTVSIPSVAAAPSAPASDEKRTAAYFESIREDPNLLFPFLREMPKGGDLHNHLTGSIYAESYIQWEADRGDCVDSQTLAFSAPPCNAPAVPAGNALADQGLYNKIVDALSMRNWQLSGQSGHDHFFDTFFKFHKATFGTAGQMLAETAARAGSQREIYQELMLTPTGKELDALAKSAGWDDDFGRLQEKLITGGLPQILATAREELAGAEEARDKILKCGQPVADPGCQVVQRFISQVARGKSKEAVFAESLAGFLLAGADPNLVPPALHMVGVNLVMAEDWYVPMSDFSLHMRMLDYLHQKYPQVHIALHAGELVERLVPPAGLQFHIRDSIAIGHAERIGHGVDVMNETQPFELLRDMAKRNVMVEICLTSNAVILGVSGPKHPLGEYIRAGVPVALATDDEGVSRSDMTHEYLRGAQDQNLSYPQLKKMARTGMEHAFVSGASMWRTDGFAVVKECEGQAPGGGKPSDKCQKFLSGNEKACLQWNLEGQFRRFESQAWGASSGERVPSKPASWQCDIRGLR